MQNAPRKAEESAVKAGINPKVVKILCGDPLEEDYVFEVKPSKKSVIPTRAVDPETNINDSEVEGESTMEPEFVIPEGPRPVMRKSSEDDCPGIFRPTDHLHLWERSHSGKGRNGLCGPGQGNACQDSRVFNALKQKICSQR